MVYPLNPSGLDADGEPIDPIEFDDVQYVSFVNFETFGIPAKIADADVRQEVRDEGVVKIVYVNTQNVSSLEVTRHA